jgi:hypothetical protein
MRDIKSEIGQLMTKIDHASRQSEVKITTESSIPISNERREPMRDITNIQTDPTPAKVTLKQH